MDQGAVAYRFMTVIRNLLRTIHKLRHFYWRLNWLTAAITNANNVIDTCIYYGPMRRTVLNLTATAQRPCFFIITKYLYRVVGTIRLKFCFSV